MLILGWVSGLLCHMLLAAAALPTYEVIAENRNAESGLSLGPTSQLDIALVPKESTLLLPHLCGFTSDGSSLTRWPLAHRVAHGGTLFVEGEVRDLFPPLSTLQESTRELVFVVSGSFSFCQPQLVEALHALDRFTELRFSRRLSALLGMQTLRLPVSFPHSRD